MTHINIYDTRYGTMAAPRYSQARTPKIPETAWMYPEGNNVLCQVIVYKLVWT